MLTPSSTSDMQGDRNNMKQPYIQNRVNNAKVPFQNNDACFNASRGISMQLF